MQLPLADNRDRARTQQLWVGVMMGSGMTIFYQLFPVACRPPSHYPLIFPLPSSPSPSVSIFLSYFRHLVGAILPVFLWVAFAVPPAGAQAETKAETATSRGSRTAPASQTIGPRVSAQRAGGDTTLPIYPRYEWEPSCLAPAIILVPRVAGTRHRRLTLKEYPAALSVIVPHMNCIGRSRLERMTFFESSSRLDLLFEHDLSDKPVPPLGSSPAGMLFRI